MRPARGATDPKTMLSLAKRKPMGDVANDKANSRKGKRARSQSTSAFHPCHLTMLQSLHQDDDEDGEDTWRMIDLFLQRRPLLMKKTKEIADLRSVHEEAVKFSQCSSSASSPHQSNPQLSPHVTMFSPPRSPPTVRQRCPNSLVLLSRLIGRKAAVSNAALQQFAKPFGPLVTVTNKQLKGLEEILATLRQDRLEKHRENMSELFSPSTSDSSFSHIANLVEDGRDGNHTIVLVESKIRLWRMLSRALKHVE